MVECDSGFGSEFSGRQDDLLYIWWTWVTIMVVLATTYYLWVEEKEN